MANDLIDTILATDPEARDRPLEALVAGRSVPELLRTCAELDAFRRESTNLYARVRASLFLHAIYRYALLESPGLPETGLIPFDGIEDLLQRRFEQAIRRFLLDQQRNGPNSAIASALAHAYELLAFQTLADQVRHSVRNCAGNRWMFRVGHPDEHPIRLAPGLLRRDPETGLFPILVERTPVRLDLSHSAWSDIFFLGMDYPEGARVLNISVDLEVHGRDGAPRPPIETFVRVIPEPLLRLTSIDLEATKDVTNLDELFNFGNDYLGLVKAGIIASGLIPPSLDGTGVRLPDILARVVRPGSGLEVISKVNDIPKGSRLAVSTNLLASLISLLMRATGQARNLVGSLQPDESRVVVARAILGEWLGGSGGGWQDSGGVFPGIKVIRGVASGPDDPEWQVSRGRLLPEHRLLSPSPGEPTPARSTEPPPPDFPSELARSLVLVHGGMAQNVGPILNMVTEKYLLRGRREWAARQQTQRIFDNIIQAVDHADVARLGQLTSQNWEGPLQDIIPWINNAYTQTLIDAARREFGPDYRGFLMLGGMSGGGMGFFVAPDRRDEFVQRIHAIMRQAKADFEDALPFAMEPVVYAFAVNPRGTQAELLEAQAARLPARYYTLQVPRMIRDGTAVSPQRTLDLSRFANRASEPAELLQVFRATLHNLFPTAAGTSATGAAWDAEAEAIKLANGFDPIQHEALRDDYQHGRIDLSRNRLPLDTDIRDVNDADLIDTTRPELADSARGEAAIAAGQVAVVTLAAGVGSRWTTGAGVVKAVNPFVSLAGRHRSFIEIHLAKTRRLSTRFGRPIPYLVTTSFLTHKAIDRHLRRTHNYGHDLPVYLSPGMSIGQRLVPMARSLQFLWEETAHEVLDENKQKVREASRRAIIEWVRSTGEGTDYTDNLPSQRFNPPGHFYELPNMIRNGVLARLLREHPDLRWLMVHNVDTLGAAPDPEVLGRLLSSGATLAFEVVPRRVDDRGGGLARVNGRLRLVEGMAFPREDAEFRLRYYNTLTTWVDIDRWLAALGLTRDQLQSGADRAAQAVRALASRLPTYVTIKDVKRRWGHGQEDVFPVAQFEKLWGDLTALTEFDSAYLRVDRRRGQQLKDAAQLDGWANDGSRDDVLARCDFAR